MHEAPEVPHASGESPDTHAPAALQQPLGQLEGVQTDVGWQAMKASVSTAAQ